MRSSSRTVTESPRSTCVKTARNGTRSILVSAMLSIRGRRYQTKGDAIVRKANVFVLSLTVLLATISVLAQRSAPGVDAKLVIPDTTTLPGVPFDMWIEVQNRSDVTIAVGLCPSF